MEETKVLTEEERKKRRESNKRKIANPSKELITVETEIIEGGFILTIEVGPGSIKVNNPE